MAYKLPKFLDPLEKVKDITKGKVEDKYLYQAIVEKEEEDKKFEEAERIKSEIDLKLETDNMALTGEGVLSGSKGVKLTGPGIFSQSYLRAPTREEEEKWDSSTYTIADQLAIYSPEESFLDSFGEGAKGFLYQSKLDKDIEESMKKLDKTSTSGRLIGGLTAGAATYILGGGLIGTAMKGSSLKLAELSIKNPILYELGIQNVSEEIIEAGARKLTGQEYGVGDFITNLVTSNLLGGGIMKGLDISANKFSKVDEVTNLKAREKEDINKLLEIQYKKNKNSTNQDYYDIIKDYKLTDGRKVDDIYLNISNKRVAEDLESKFFGVKSSQLPSLKEGIGGSIKKQTDEEKLLRQDIDVIFGGSILGKQDKEADLDGLEFLKYDTENSLIKTEAQDRLLRAGAISENKDGGYDLTEIGRGLVGDKAYNNIMSQGGYSHKTGFEDKVTKNNSKTYLNKRNVKTNNTGSKAHSEVINDVNTKIVKEDKKLSKAPKEEVDEATAVKNAVENAGKDTTTNKYEVWKKEFNEALITSGDGSKKNINKIVKELNAKYGTDISIKTKEIDNIDYFKDVWSSKDFDYDTYSKLDFDSKLKYIDDIGNLIKPESKDNNYKIIKDYLNKDRFGEDTGLAKRIKALPENEKFGFTDEDFKPENINDTILKIYTSGKSANSILTSNRKIISQKNIDRLNIAKLNSESVKKGIANDKEVAKVKAELQKSYQEAATEISTGDFYIKDKSIINKYLTKKVKNFNDIEKNLNDFYNEMNLKSFNNITSEIDNKLKLITKKYKGKRVKQMDAMMWDDLMKVKKNYNPQNFNLDELRIFNSKLDSYLKDGKTKFTETKEKFFQDIVSYVKQFEEEGGFKMNTGAINGLREAKNNFNNKASFDTFNSITQSMRNIFGDGIAKKVIYNNVDNAAEEATRSISYKNKYFEEGYQYLLNNKNISSREFGAVLLSKRTKNGNKEGINKLLGSNIALDKDGRITTDKNSAVKTITIEDIARWEKIIDNDSQLSKFRKRYWDFIENHSPGLNDVAYKYDNTPEFTTKNYVPLLTGRERGVEDLLGIQSDYTNPSKLRDGFLEATVDDLKGDYSLNTDMSAIINSFDNQIKYKYMRGPMKEATTMVDLLINGNKEFEIDKQMGKDVSDFIKGYYKHLVNPYGDDLVDNFLLDTLQRFATQSAYGLLSVKTAAMQPVGLIDAVKTIGLKYATNGVKNLKKGNNSTIAKDLSANLYNRTELYNERVVRDLYGKKSQFDVDGKVKSGTKKVINSVLDFQEAILEKISGNLIRAADNGTATSVWLGAAEKFLADEGYKFNDFNLEKIIRKFNSTEDGKRLISNMVDYSDDMMKITMGSTNIGDIPPKLRSQYFRAMFTLGRTAMNRNMYYINDAYQAFRKGDVKGTVRALGKATPTLLASSALLTGIQYGWDEGREGLGIKRATPKDSSYLISRFATSAVSLPGLTSSSGILGEKIDSIIKNFKDGRNQEAIIGIASLYGGANIGLGLDFITQKGLPKEYKSGIFNMYSKELTGNINKGVVEKAKSKEIFDNLFDKFSYINTGNRDEMMKFIKENNKELSQYKKLTGDKVIDKLMSEKKRVLKERRNEGMSKEVLKRKALSNQEYKRRVRNGEITKAQYEEDRRYGINKLK